MIGTIVAVGGPRRVDDATGEDQAGPVMLTQSVEVDGTAHTAGAGAANGRSADIGVDPIVENCVGNDHRRARSLGAGGDIQGMQALDVMRAAVARLFGLDDDVERRSGVVNDGGSGYADLWHNVAGKYVGLRDRGHTGSRVDEAGLPEEAAVASRIRVRREERIHDQLPRPPAAFESRGTSAW